MSFSENLKATRKLKNFSQEQLAELLNVSRQAISKWEQGEGYPETEKLIQLAKLLDVPLDYLLLDKQPATTENGSDAKTNTKAALGPSKISVRSYDGNTLSTFCDFVIIRSAFPTKNQPKCLLGGKPNNWWEGVTTLGWYATIEDAQMELDEINRAIQNGEATYQLKYYVNIKGSFNPQIVDSNPKK